MSAYFSSKLTKRLNAAFTATLLVFCLLGTHTERIGKVNWTGYLILKNLLNEEIRYATSPMAVRLYAPQPGRNFMLGLRAAF